jgi:mRNA interferase HigB
MWIVKPSTVRDFAARNSTARGGLEHWLRVARDAEWTCLDDVRETFRSADEVKVDSGRMVVVFNIKRNDYRLITAIHYNMQKVFILRFMTHAEYGKEQWKRQL